MDLLISVGAFVVLMALGLFVGGSVERRHFALLDEREARNGSFVVTQLKSYPGFHSGPQAPTIVCGEAVISSDYLKTFLATVRKIFGGEVHSYRSLLERARRESLQRLVEEAQGLGFNAVCNVRYVSTDISGASKRPSRAVMVTILAYGTAYQCGPAPPAA